MLPSSGCVNDSSGGENLMHYTLTAICTGVCVPCCCVDAGRRKYGDHRAKCIVHVQPSDGRLDRLQPCLRELHQDAGRHYSHCVHEVLRELFKLRLLAVYGEHFILCAQQRCAAHITPRRLMVWYQVERRLAAQEWWPHPQHSAPDHWAVDGRHDPPPRLGLTWHCHGLFRECERSVHAV